MGHDHHHHHHHGRSLWEGLILTLGFALVEAVGGWWSGSLALLGDAAHMVTDGLALGLAALAAWLARRPPSPRHSYGLLRLEVVAALVNALFMLVVVAGISWEAWQRWHEPRPVDGALVVVIAALGLLVNALVAWRLLRGERDLNVRAALLHVAGDFLGSVAALVAGIVILWTGWYPIDPLLSVLVCLLILVSTLRLLREVLHVILEGVPLHLDLERIGRALATLPGVVSVHDLHVWTLASGRIALTAHVVIQRMDVWPTVLAEAHRVLRDRFHIDHITLQPEPIEVRVPLSVVR